MAHRRAESLETWRCAWGAMLGARSLGRLRLGCSFVPSTEPNNWFTVVEDPRRITITQFELRYGLQQQRTDYNLMHVARARGSRTTQVGHRGGFADLFVPVVRHGIVKGVLACGPILDRRPTAELLQEDWRSICRRVVDPDDEAFLSFVRATLDSYLFEGRSFELLRDHVEQTAAIMAGTTYAYRRDMKGWVTIRDRVPEASMWALASELVDPHANARWMATYRDADRTQEGIALMPDYVVAVAPSWRGGGPPSAAEVMIWTHEFQRCSAAVARELPNTIAGRVGGEAAFFLTHLGKQRKDGARPRLIALGERIGRLVRRKLEVDVVCGFSERAVEGGELPIRYDQALCAVFWGLHKHQAMTFQADAGSRESAMNGLYGSARVLCRSFASGEHRETFVAAERVVRDVLWISTGSLEAMRSHFLEILWELLALTDRRDVVDERTSSQLRASFSARLGRSRAIHELTGAFTQLIRELLGMLERPSELGRRAKLERARRLVELAVLEQGARETPLDLASVAARVGMSRASFARSFQLTYKTTFGAYVLQSRIERSKQLLRNTKLRVVEVSAEAGWSSASYFHQAFKRLTGVTPEQYRAGRDRDAGGG